MLPVETILPPARWTLEQAIDLAELLTLALAHPDRKRARVGSLCRGRLEVERDDRGHPLSLRFPGERAGEIPPWARCAPEVRAGRAAGAQTDLYLLGVVLYEVLTGRPFPATIAPRSPALELRYVPGLSQIIHSVLDWDHRRGVTTEAVLEAVQVARSESVRQVVSLEVGQVSSLGRCAPRLRNQDACGAMVRQSSRRSRAEVSAALVVADGVGSTVSGGEVAARVVEELLEAFLGVSASAGFEGLYHHTGAYCFEMASRGVAATVAACRSDDGLRQGGSTCVMALVAGSRVSVANLGDSRAYLIPAEGDPVALTVDQSIAGGAYAAGQADWAQLRSGWGDIIMRCVSGGPDATHIDALVGLEEALPGQSSARLVPGDTLALVSDGVWGKIGDAAIADIVRAAPTAQRAAEDLLAAVEEARGDDNTTAVIARPRFQAPPPVAASGPVGRTCGVKRRIDGPADA